MSKLSWIVVRECEENGLCWMNGGLFQATEDYDEAWTLRNDLAFYNAGDKYHVYPVVAPGEGEVDG